ncbi:polyprenyl synthetase family protein [Candidatus Woesearchaeota archaeon]|nr:polyprenyl synthetase family protein [Candidatus Woesearchaeota archaeon]
MTLTLKEYKAIVDKEIEKFFNKKLKKAENIDSSSVELIKILKKYCLGGKRIRAAMLFHGYRCFKNKNLKEIVKASMSIELIQSYFLIHDDIMDRSDIRRGKPALHKVYEKISKKRYKKSDHPHFGASMAILAGDILVAFADEIIADLKNIRPRHKNAAIKKLQHINHTVIYGQVLDILSELKPVTIKDISLIHRMKTASYTVEGPLHVGALLAGANKKQLKILKKYGVPLGKAFQIQDDILGLFGDEKKTGKPADSDVKEGKQTLLILKALEKADPKQKTTIKRALGNPNLTKSQLEEVRNIVKQTGSLEYCQNLAKSLIQKAKSALKKARFKKQGREFLLGEIAEYMLERKY